MAALRRTLRFLPMASTLALGSSVLMLTAAHGAQRMSAPPQPTQQQAQFTPPDDSQVDGDTILTSTGTYFRPPSDPSPTSGPRTSTGTRQGGCLGVTETAFAIFGPKATDKVVGQTASTRPTFVWHLPETERRFPVIFRLLAPDTDGIPTAIYQTTFDYTPGFISHQLPVPVPALSQGIEYRWQVIIECNPAYPSRAMLQELSFEVVPGPTGLSQTLAAANTSTERAIAYGQAGLWYDAIAEVAAATTPEDQQTRSGLLTDLAASLPDTEAQLQQDILGIVETAR